MGTSDLIAAFIMNALDETNGRAELQRASIAERFSCVPSQINYVISTRFSPEHGYIVESRRGGGGFIRITKVQNDPTQLIMHTVNSVGESLDMHTAQAFISNIVDAEALDQRTGRLLLVAISNKALAPIKPEHRDFVRASIFKQLLVYSLE